MGSIPEPESLLPPPGAWDSHCHVVDEDTFPLHPLHPYRPKKATLTDLQSFHKSLGIDHACLVAFSVYHTDNRCILDAVTRLNGKGRAVACIDTETITDSELQHLHDAGVRGIRLNLRTRRDKVDCEAIRLAARRIRHLGWILQVYVALEQIRELTPIVPELGVTVCIDHLGEPDPSRGPARTQPGYDEFMDLLRSGTVWTKLSGTYRFPDLEELDEYVAEILRVAPDRVVWASDWPHSGGVQANPKGDRNQVQDYRKIDDVAWVARCREWCRRVEGGTGDRLARKIWVDNPRRLWQYQDGD